MSLNGLFLSFSALCDLKNTFFRKKNQKFFFEKFFFPNFSNSCSLNIFEPKIWRRLGTFPSCFSFPAYNLTLNGPLFTICSSCSSSTKFLKPESGGSILALNHNIFMLPKVQQVRPKGPPFGFFSALCDFFSKIFGFYQSVTPCIFLKFSVCKNV